MGGQRLGGLLSHLTDAQRKDQPPQVVLLALVDGGHGVGGRLVPHTLQRLQVRRGQVVEVGGSLDQSALDKLVHPRRPQPVDVHGIAAGEVGQVPQTLSGTLRPGAAQGCAILVPLHRRSADGAGMGQIVGLRPGGTLARHHGDDLRDDLPGLLHHHGIPDADILLGDVILIV